MDLASKVLVIVGGVGVAAGALGVTILDAFLSLSIGVGTLAIGIFLLGFGLRRAYRPHWPQP